MTINEEGIMTNAILTQIFRDSKCKDNQFF